MRISDWSSDVCSSDLDFLCDSFHCTPFHRSSALYPLVERLRRLAGLSADDAPVVALSKLRGVLKGAAGDAEEILRLLAPLFSLAPGEAEAAGEEGHGDLDRLLEILESGRAACRERVGQYG